MSIIQAKDVKKWFGDFNIFTVMDPTSLQDAGMKKKSRFSAFQRT